MKYYKQVTLLLVLALLHLPVLGMAQNGTDTLGTETAQEEVVQNADSVAQQGVTANGEEGAEADADDTGTESRLGEIRELISFNVIFLTLLILAITYFLNKFVVQILDNISEKSVRYRLFTKRLVPIVRIAIWSFSLYIIIAGIIDPPFETVLTVTASIGIAVGFASQDILKNVFGGFIIILDRPFQVGDKIQVGEYYGEVLQIGLRSCRIVTPDDSIVTIPNGELMNKAVSNANSSALDCQVVAEIYLPADIDVELVKRIAYKAAISSRYAYLQKPVNVIAKNEIHEKNYVIKLRVKAYVLDIRYEFPFQSDMTELILAELNERKLIPGHLPQAS
ncbi:MAG: mechanosensitive ion channel [Balneolaceae bacterium]|nr:mechanosensitive ion channel [Balneolaceae bacterium]